MAKLTQRETGGLYELTDAARQELSGSPYYNEDLAPTRLSERTWDTYHIASLWIGMSVCLPTYMLASSLMSLGLSWWQAILNIALGNLIVLIPMQLNSHAGTKYGIPYPVFARLSFGVKGAHIAAIARAIVAAGWFGIQTWIGGGAINTIIGALIPSWAAWSGGIWISFFGFWAVNVYIAYRGAEAIKFMEAWGAPILGFLSLAIMIWAVVKSGSMGYSVGDILNMPAAVEPGKFWTVFLGGLTANIAFWSTLALNIPDFSRYAKTQRSQFRGQLYGLPTTMAAFAFVGVFVTGATKLIFGEMIWDPVVLISKIGSPIAVILGAVGVIIATLTTNIAANIVAPANGISNINPKKISYRMGAVVTGIAGVIIMPWKLLALPGGYIFSWLGTYGIFLGPLAGIYISDYYIYRQKRLDVMGLFQGSEGRYWYGNGFNSKAVITWVLASILPLIGKIVPSMHSFADNGYIISFVIALIIYPLLMKSDSSSLLSEEEEKAITER